MACPEARSNIIFLEDLRKMVLFVVSFQTISMAYFKEHCKYVQGPIFQTNLPYLCLILHSIPTTKSTVESPIIVAEMVLLLYGLRFVLRCTCLLGLSSTKLPWVSRLSVETGINEEVLVGYSFLNMSYES